MMRDRFRRQQTWRSFLERFWPDGEEGGGSSEALHEQIFLREELRQLVHEVLGRLGADKRVGAVVISKGGRLKKRKNLGSRWERLHHDCIGRAKNCVSVLCASASAWACL